MDAVLLARIQFGLVAGYHFLFPPITLGLSFVIVILETLYLKKRAELYKNVSNFLIKLSGDLCNGCCLSAGLLNLWGIVGAIHFLNLVKASTGESLSITIFDASSSQLTLTVMLIIALIGMPLVIVYTIYANNVFQGKVQDDETSS